MNTFKKTAVTFMVISMLAIGGASASAQVDTTTTDAPTTQEDRGPRGPRGANDEIREAQAALVTEYTGLAKEEVREAIREGSTLAALIEANDASVDEYIAASLALHAERVNGALAAGEITEEQAEEILANMEDRITERVNATFEPGENDGPRSPRDGEPGDGPRGPRGPGNDDGGPRGPGNGDGGPRGPAGPDIDVADEI